MATDEVDSFLRGVASAPAVRPPPRIGERLGERYVIEAFLGEGGMGSVYRALDEKLGEQVALKIVKPGLDEAALRDEVRLAQKVTHVNVCRTFDLEDVDGRSIVKMEYVAGETLATRLDREGKLPIDEAVRIARAIATGLGIAHAQGIVHSDLKPGNVMLADQRVVLMDFGVAHLAASPNEGVHGTVGYLAPEKLREESGDARSDEYALGCVLYEMLAGERVFGTGAAIVTAARHVSDPVPDVRKKRPEVSRWLARATSALLAKDPAARDVGMVRLAAGRRSPLRIVVPVIAILVALVMVGVRVTRRPWIPVIWDPPSVSDENLDAPAFSPDGRWIIYSSDRLQKDRKDHREKWDTFVMSRASGESLLLDVPNDGGGDSRWTRDGKALLLNDPTKPSGSRWSYVRQAVAGSPPQLVGPQTEVAPWASAVDDCGDAIVYTQRSPQGWRLLLHTAVGPDKLLFKAGAMQSLNMPRCDPTGTRIAIAIGQSNSNAPTNGDLYVIDRATGELHQLTHDHSVTCGGPFANGGKTVIFARVVNDHSQLYEIAVTGGSPRRLIDDGVDAGYSDISSDGKELLFTRDTTSWVPTLSNGENRTFLTRAHGNYFHGSAIDHDTLLFQRVWLGHSEIVLLHIPTQKMDTVWSAGESPFASFDRKSIYFTDPRDRHMLEQIPLTGGTPTPVATLPGRILAGSAGPAGNHVLVEVEGEQFGYLITRDGTITPERTHGMVTEAPSGGWRAVTTLEPGAQILSVVPPNTSLDHPSQTFNVVSFANRWLDDHTLAYCTQDQCEELDVSTGERKALHQPSPPPPTFEIDGGRVVSIGTLGEATMHVITNFGDR